MYFLYPNFSQILEKLRMGNDLQHNEKMEKFNENLDGVGIGRSKRSLQNKITKNQKNCDFLQNKHTYHMTKMTKMNEICHLANACRNIKML